MPKAGIGERGESAVPEVEERAHRRPRSDAPGPSPVMARTLRTRAAAQQPNDIDLVRRLVEDDAAALVGGELLGPARPVEEIGEVERA